MSNATTLHYISLLALSSATPPKLTMKFDYGLILDVLPDGSVAASLSDSVISKEKAERGAKTSNGFKYRIFPDWGTSHLFYDSSWPSNPPDMLNAEDEEILKDHSAAAEDARLKAWLRAYNGWAKNYDDAFDKELNNTGDFDREVFPDLDVRRAWSLEGLMLAVWLALLPDVDAVEFSPGKEKVVLSSRGYGEHPLNEAVGLFLKDLDSHLA